MWASQLVGRVPPGARRSAVVLAAALLALAAGAVATAVLTAEPRSQLALAEPRGLARSAPVRIVIPRLGVDAEVRPLARDRDGGLGVPQRATVAGWYAGGTSPGEPGSAVIVGHTGDYRGGPAIFARLDRLVPRDLITVHRADRTVARFSVDRVVPYSPVERGHGAAGEMSLRLVPAYPGGPPPPAAVTAGSPAVRVGGAPPPQPVVFATFMSADR